MWDSATAQIKELFFYEIHVPGCSTLLWAILRKGHEGVVVVYVG